MQIIFLGLPFFLQEIIPFPLKDSFLDVETLKARSRFDHFINVVAEVHILNLHSGALLLYDILQLIFGHSW